jgi:hypothetical protein
MVGHFLQDQVIQIGIRKGYDFYNISMEEVPEWSDSKKDLAASSLGF